MDRTNAPAPDRSPAALVVAPAALTEDTDVLLAELVARGHALPAGFDGQRLAGLLARLAFVERDRDALRASHAELTVRCEALEAATDRLDALQARLDAAQGEAAEATARADALTRETAAQRTELEVLRAHAAPGGEGGEGGAVAPGDLRATVLRLFDEWQVARVRVEELEARLAEQVTAHQRTAERASACDRRYARLEAWAARLAEQRDAAEAHCDQVRENADGWHDVAVALEVIVREQQAELAVRRAAVEQAWREVGRLRDLLAATRRQNAAEAG